MFEQGFYGLCGVPNFFSLIMVIHSAGIIAQKQAISNIDVFLGGKTENDLWKKLGAFFQCLRSSGLKVVPNRTKRFLRKTQFLGHLVSDKGSEPAADKVQDLKSLRSPRNKRDIMHILSCLDFYSTFINNLHWDSTPLYELLRDEVPFNGTKIK